MLDVLDQVLIYQPTTSPTKNRTARHLSFFSENQYDVNQAYPCFFVMFAPYKFDIKRILQQVGLSKITGCIKSHYLSH